MFIANPSIKVERIIGRSIDIMQIADLKTRHETIKGLYDKFVLFSDLFEQGGDLAILRKDVEYNQTNVLDKMPTKPISHPRYSPNGWKPNQFDYLRKYFFSGVYRSYSRRNKSRNNRYWQSTWWVGLLAYSTCSISF